MSKNVAYAKSTSHGWSDINVAYRLIVDSFVAILDDAPPRMPFSAEEYVAGASPPIGKPCGAGQRPDNKVGIDMFCDLNVALQAGNANSGGAPSRCRSAGRLSQPALNACLIVCVSRRTPRVTPAHARRDL
jgi:hypothetical protein